MCFFKISAAIFSQIFKSKYAKLKKVIVKMNKCPDTGPLAQQKKFKANCVYFTINKLIIVIFSSWIYCRGELEVSS